jgi:hypothetical protein
MTFLLALRDDGHEMSWQSRIAAPFSGGDC